MYTYKLGGFLITDELYHDDLEAMTFGRKDQNELMHHGIKGQSWGKRRFQNEDGSLTAAGRNRYDVGDPRQGVTAYSDTGGRGGSGVSYRATGASRSSGSVSNSQPRARIATRPQQTSGTRPVSQSVMNRANNGKKAADNLFGRIGNLASNAAKNVSNTATNAYNNATQWAGDRAREVGEAAKNLGQNISDWYTGDPNARDAERYDNMVQRFEEAGDRNVNAGNRMLDKAAKTPETAYDLESGQKLADKRAIEGLDQLNYGYDQHDLAKRYGEKADEAQARYEAAPRQMLDRAGNWIGDKAREAGEAVRDTVSNLGNTQEVRNAANAVNGARDWIDNAARNVGNFVGDNYNRAREAVAGAANDVGEAAKNVGNFASENYNRAREAVSGVANDVGEAAKNVGQKVSDWYTGDPNARDAERYDNMVQRFEEAGDRNVNAGNDKIINADKWPDSAYDIETGQKMRNKVFNEGLNQRNFGFNQHDLASEYGWKAREAQDRYDNAPRQLLDKAGNWIGDRVNDASDWIGNTAKDAYNNIDYRLYSLGQDMGQPARNRAYQDFLDKTAKDRETFNREFPTGDMTAARYADARINNAFGEYQRELNKIRQNPIGSTINNAASDVVNWGGQQVENGKKLLKRIFG